MHSRIDRVFDSIMDKLVNTTSSHSSGEIHSPN